MIKRLVLVLMMVCMVVALCSCRQSEIVSYNLSKEADAFNVTRRLAVLNARSDSPLFELVGNFSLSNNGVNELEITVEIAPGQYRKHFVYLNEWTLYVVEDVSGAYVSPYHYEVNFIPETLDAIHIVTDY